MSALQVSPMLEPQTDMRLCINIQDHKLEQPRICIEMILLLLLNY